VFLRSDPTKTCPVTTVASAAEGGGVEYLVRACAARLVGLGMALSNIVIPASRPRSTVPSRASSLSERLWDLDWSRLLPWAFEDVEVESACFDEALPFMREHYPAYFRNPDASFLNDPHTEAKRRFFEETDVFAFRAQGRTVGVLMSHPSDWTTYYMRTTAILPEYRDRRLLTRFMERIYGPLRDAGVERIEGEISPANVPMVRMLTGQGFMLTSTASSERWGFIARFTKFLLPEAEDAFMRQYCSMPLKGRFKPQTATQRRTS
jgi:hypothetical protein